MTAGMFNTAYSAPVVCDQAASSDEGPCFGPIIFKAASVGKYMLFAERLSQEVTVKKCLGSFKYTKAHLYVAAPLKALLFCPCPGCWWNSVCRSD